MTSLQPSYPSTLPLASIVKGDNPRRYFDRKKHEEMVASIRGDRPPTRTVRGLQ